MPDTEDSPPDNPLEPLLRDGLVKSGVLWVGPTETETRPAWFAYVEPHVHLVTGPGEQELLPLEDEAVLILRAKDTRHRTLVVPARVERLTPEDDRWEPATTALAKARLNAPELPAAMPERWARSATVLALTPALEHAHR